MRDAFSIWRPSTQSTSPKFGALGGWHNSTGRDRNVLQKIKTTIMRLNTQPHNADMRVNCVFWFLDAMLRYDLQHIMRIFIFKMTKAANQCMQSPASPNMPIGPRHSSCTRQLVNRIWRNQRHMTIHTRHQPQKKCTCKEASHHQLRLQYRRTVVL